MGKGYGYGVASGLAEFAGDIEEGKKEGFWND